MVKGTCGTKKSGWVLKKEWVVDEEMRGKWKFFLMLKATCKLEKKEGDNWKCVRRRREEVKVWLKSKFFFNGEGNLWTKKSGVFWGQLKVWVKSKFFFNAEGQPVD